MVKRLRDTRYFKVALIILILSTIAVIIVLSFLRGWTVQNPELVQSTINFVDQYGVLGMFTFAFLAGTIIPFPVEPVLGGMVVLGSSQIILLILAAALGHTLGTIISFYLARYLREPFVYKKIDKKSINAFHNFWDKHGTLVLFVTVLIPGPGDIVAFIAGLSKMNIKKFVAIMVSAKLITYTFFALVSFQVAATWFSAVI